MPTDMELRRLCYFTAVAPHVYRVAQSEGLLGLCTRGNGLQIDHEQANGADFVRRAGICTLLVMPCGMLAMLCCLVRHKVLPLISRF